MKPIRIAVCHKDQVYAKALTEALSARWHRASICMTEPDSDDPLSGMDRILCGSAAHVMRYGSRGIHLYDDPEDMESDQLSIHRFQPIERITAQLRNLCDHASGVLPVAEDVSETIFWGFTSGVGGSGTSSLAISTGRILSRLHGMEVLLIGFGRFICNGGDFHSRSDGRSMGQYLYRISGGEGLSASLLQACCRKDAFDLTLLGGPDRENPLCFAEEEDVYQLMRHIARYGGFQRVLLDVPAEISCWKNVMRLCERQIVNFGCQKHRFGPSEIQAEILRERCLDDGADPDVRIYTFHPLEDQDSFLPDQQGSDVDIHGQFGAEVRALVDRMENQ
ncbi:MAG TPA: hypothetical protein DF480_04280 [Clostridiales bacterium]|nr:hypothetical protein [Clostridiales bacterium]